MTSAIPPGMRILRLPPEVDYNRMTRAEQDQHFRNNPENANAVRALDHLDSQISQLATHVHDITEHAESQQRIEASKQRALESQKKTDSTIDRILAKMEEQRKIDEANRKRQDEFMRAYEERQKQVAIEDARRAEEDIARQERIRKMEEESARRHEAHEKDMRTSGLERDSEGRWMYVGNKEKTVETVLIPEAPPIPLTERSITVETGSEKQQQRKLNFIQRIFQVISEMFSNLSRYLLLSSINLSS